MSKNEYFAQQTGWLLGEHRRKGDSVKATEEEAKYLLLAGTLGTEKPKTVAEQKAITDAANGVEGIVVDDEVDEVSAVVEEPVVEEPSATEVKAEDTGRKRRG